VRDENGIDVPDRADVHGLGALQKCHAPAQQRIRYEPNAVQLYEHGAVTQPRQPQRLVHVD
jgi:hypothetical protein